MIYLGIDPDIKDSGIACWDSKLKEFDYIKNMIFWEVIEEFECWNIPITVVIEAGWLIKKSNWHIIKFKKVVSEATKKIVGERIAKNVGANHQVGILFKEYCEVNNIKHILVKPKGKVNSNYFKRITGYDKRTNQDQRDAAMLVFNL